MDKAKVIQKILIGLDIDLKGEVIIEGLIENGYVKNDWITSYDGQFRRSFSKDLQFVDSLQSGNKELVNFHISRDGIYDSLPESLFHTVSDKPTESGHEMAIDSKKERKREGEIRRFFSLFEQESFLIRLLIERKEREFLARIVQGQLSDFFTKFWKADWSVDTKLLGKMVDYLPFMQKILGNFELTFNLLESIIEEQVSYNIIKNRKSDEFNFVNEETSGFTLGEASLSWDFVCGDAMMDLTPIIEISLGPLRKSPISDYIDRGKGIGFIDCFCSFFLPFEMDYSITLKTNKTREFVLSNSGEEVIMGFDTYI